MAIDSEPLLPEDGCLLFAYGTLQRGGEYHQLMRDCAAACLGEARLLTPYPLVIHRYPCLLDHPGRGFPVEGELYRIPRSADWAALDRLEDHPREYRRRPEAVAINGQTVHAWTYFYIRGDIDPDSLPPVPRFRPRR
jgi:gamma-glutamylcyclotransferase (GGCT)/AIG2-like uncharacterized protein YtfP